MGAGWIAEGVIESMFSVLKKLGWFFRMHWKRYAVAITLLVLTGILDIIPPWLLGYVIDGINQNILGTVEFNRVMFFWIGLTVIGYIITYVWHYQLFGGAFVLERLLRSKSYGPLYDV